MKSGGVVGSCIEKCRCFPCFITHHVVTCKVAFTIIIYCTVLVSLLYPWNFCPSNLCLNFWTHGEELAFHHFHTFQGDGCHSKDSHVLMWPPLLPALSPLTPSFLPASLHLSFGYFIHQEYLKRMTLNFYMVEVAEHLHKNLPRKSFWKVPVMNHWYII